jgi:Cytochrome c554 and c-prime
VQTRLALTIIVGLGSALAISAAYTSPLIAEASESRSSARAGEPMFLGAGSCASTACHGHPVSFGVVGSEYSIWAARDKHARAYEVLFQPRSVKMAEYLDPKTPAHENVLCLSCHVLPESKWVNSQIPAFYKTDGVSCESCHGPARGWIAEHYQPSWKAKSADDKLALGMWDTKTLPARTKLCVECHVGSPGTEVTHDLLAAGHPRLNFEFAAFHASMPRHWPDRLDKDPAQGGHTDFETRAWVLGQLQSAEAAMQLLQAHANGKGGMELADRDCYACHHDLQGKSWRQSPGSAGNIPWNSWYFTQLPTALSAVSNPHGPDLLKMLDQIRQKKVNPDDTQKIAEWLQPPQDLHKIDPMSLFKDVMASDAKSWDDAAQAYLTLAAIHNTWTDQKNDEPAKRLRPVLVDWRASLRFPSGTDSPKTFDPQAVRVRLKALQN